MHVLHAVLVFASVISGYNPYVPSPDETSLASYLEELLPRENSDYVESNISPYSSDSRTVPPYHNKPGIVITITWNNPAHTTIVCKSRQLKLGGLTSTDNTAPSPIFLSTATSKAPSQNVGLSSAMPYSIEAPGVVDQPDRTTLIRIVFNRLLNYEFIAGNATASQQVFVYLPKVIGHGQGIKGDRVHMVRLSPITASQKQNWITAAAFAYVPDEVVESLQVNIRTTNSNIYKPPHPISESIAATIDPSYDILPGPRLDVGSGESRTDTVGKAQATQKATAAGIAVGTVGAAVAFIAVTFLVTYRCTRRRDRRQSGDSDILPSMMRFSKDISSPHRW